MNLKAGNSENSSAWGLVQLCSITQIQKEVANLGIVLDSLLSIMGKSEREVRRN